MQRIDRYWAFLSYSHDDRRVAERLHRALEGYRVPARLVGSDGPFGPVPARLQPIFRDRDELGAGGQLGADVEAALAGSRTLIVVCSPSAAASTWVDAEVRTFGALHPDAPLFCVIAPAESAHSHDQDGFFAALPAAAARRFAAATGIDQASPLAVDLRRGGDGWRLAVHRIVAGMTGLRLDQLVQRDAQRRHRRMAALSIALAGVAIAFAVLATQAARARDEAHAQRVQAEGLVEFMLIDLRRTLEPVGRLDALAAVGTRALRYYDQQPPGALDADSLGMRARALHLIGEISDRRGDLRDARAAFARAGAVTAELLARAPDDPSRMFDHAQSVYWSGYIDREYGDGARAEAAFIEYGRLSRRASAMRPGNLAWLAEVGYAHSNLGVLQLEQGRPIEAISAFRKSLSVNERLATLPVDPTTARLDIAQDHSWLSSAYRADRQLDRAIVERRLEIALYDAMLRAAPNDAQVQARQMTAQGFMAELQLAAGNRAQASRDVARALALSEAQRAIDPADTAWRQSRVKSLVLSATLARGRDAFNEAQARLDDAAALVARQLARDPDAWVWRLELQESVAAEQAALSLQRGHLVRASVTVEAARERLEEIRHQPRLPLAAMRHVLANEALQARLATLRRDDGAMRLHWRRVRAMGLDPAVRHDPANDASFLSAERALAEQARAAVDRRPMDRAVEASPGIPRGGTIPASTNVAREESADDRR